MPEIVVLFTGGIILILYLVLIVRYSVAILTYAEPSHADIPDGKVSVSLIIPFRNEAQNLPHIILDAQAQLYPADKFEVILINDHSEDHSVEIVEQLLNSENNIRLLKLPAHLKGKKEAITLGVKEACGEWIIQSDADCRLPDGFIGEHARMAAANYNSIIAGAVVIDEPDILWQRVESLEFLSLTGSTMGAFLVKRPIMCNGANLSYSKKFYLESEPDLSMVNSPSGDDIFLLGKAKKIGLDTVYLMSDQSVVKTSSSVSALAFLRQRIRWGSKARYYSDFDMRYAALLVFLVNLMILGLLISWITGAVAPYLFVIFLLVKSAADFLLLAAASSHFRKRALLWYFPLLAIFYYFYLAVTGLLSILAGYKWKGRKYK